MLVTLVKGDRKIKLALLRPINENAIGTIGRLIASFGNLERVNFRIIKMWSKVDNDNVDAKLWISIHMHATIINDNKQVGQIRSLKWHMIDRLPRMIEVTVCGLIPIGHMSLLSWQVGHMPTT